jgi:hypothetical protein
VGESFVGLSGTLSKIEMAVRKSANQAPQDDMIVTLYNYTDRQIVNSGILVGKNVVTQTSSWYIYTLPSPVNLNPAKTYLVYLSSPKTTSARRYFVSATVADTSLIPITFASNNGQMVWSTNSGSSFNFRAEADLSTIHLISPGGYSTLGEIISSSLDTGGASGFLSISWVGNKPAGTNIQFQIATNDNNTSWVFLGPDGTSATYYAASGDYIFTGASNHRYVRYRLLLTGNGLISPRLDEVRVYYAL